MGNTRKYALEHRKEISEYMKRYKKVAEAAARKAKQVPCKDCGNSYPYYVMDFDHRHSKKFGIGQRRSVSILMLTAEIAKCDVVCANCHRIRTHRRRLRSRL